MADEKQQREEAPVAEQEKKSEPRGQAGGGGQGAPRAAGRGQAGEAEEGQITTRVPRGVGEPPSDAKADEGGVRELQEHVEKQVNEQAEQGFRGTKVDPTPNENYTLRGVGQGLPTPETVVYTPRG